MIIFLPFVRGLSLIEASYILSVIGLLLLLLLRSFPWNVNDKGSTSFQKLEGVKGNIFPLFLEIVIFGIARCFLHELDWESTTNSGKS